MRRGVGPGGSEGVGPPLESGIYRVKIIFKKISYLYGPPLKKICSLAPAYALLFVIYVLICYCTYIFTNNIFSYEAFYKS